MSGPSRSAASTHVWRSTVVGSQFEPNSDSMKAIGSTEPRDISDAFEFILVQRGQEWGMLKGGAA